MKAHAGFTLVEVLVALLVMATLAAMAWRGIDVLVRSREIAQARLEQTSRLQTVMAQWEADLNAAQKVPPSPERVSFDGARLLLTRRQPQGLQVVVWSLRDGALYRWAGPVVRSLSALQNSAQQAQQAPQAQLAIDGIEALRAFEGVSGWQFYCYWGNAWANCQSTGGNSGLKAMRMVLQFSPQSGWGGPLLREIELAGD